MWYTQTTPPPIPNISKHGLQSRHTLKNNNDLIVKPADKGRAIVIKTDFLLMQLNTPDHYQKLPHDHTPEILAEAKRLSYNVHKSQ